MAELAVSLIFVATSLRAVGNSCHPLAGGWQDCAMEPGVLTATHKHQLARI